MRRSGLFGRRILKLVRYSLGNNARPYLRGDLPTLPPRRGMLLGKDACRHRDGRRQTPDGIDGISVFPPLENLEREPPR